MSNMAIYDIVRHVPNEAIKKITGGRLKGMNDINPMWRIQKLTEQFGIVGYGWKYEIVHFWIEEGANNEKAAFAQIGLYIKHNDVWSDPIPGIGGSSFVANEKNGKYTNDECFKMALTDAISVSCKAIGIGADVYFSKGGETKYSNVKPNNSINKENDMMTNQQRIELTDISKNNVDLIKTIINNHGYNNSGEVPSSKYEKIKCDVLLAMEEYEKQDSIIEEINEPLPWE